MRVYWKVFSHIFEKEFIHLESMQHFIDLLMARATTVTLEHTGDITTSWGDITDFTPETLLSAFFH